MITAVFVLLGCWVYCLLAITAAFFYRKSTYKPLFIHKPKRVVGISILKPLSGLDEGLETNLRSYFEQDYGLFEMLFAVRTEDDPSVLLVRRLMREFPAIPAQLVITGEPPYPHAKVFSLQCMYEKARYDLIAMCDSDVRVGKDFLTTIAEDFEDQNVGLVTCPYRAVSGSSIWSRLEAIGMNTDFHAGLFTAVFLEGKKFAVGPTIVARREVLEGIGGLERVKDYISEDFMLGHIAAQMGFGVAFSSYVIEHRIGSESLLQSIAHRMRWARTSRRSRAWGYLGQFFTHTLPVSGAVLLIWHASWPLMLVTTAFRFLTAWTVSVRVLGARVNWLLLPIQDLLGFLFWIAGFFGRSVMWRGHRYLLRRDGTVVPAG